MKTYVDFAEPFEDDKASEKERKYVNSYENPEYRDYWGIDDEPDEIDPPEPDDIPDLTCYDKNKYKGVIKNGNNKNIYSI